ncbi:5,10-methylenetetrahydrofolate reductase, small subunit, partial [hydrothermal vent metagenome]
MGLLRRLQNHPAFLEKMYDLTHTGVYKLHPLIKKLGYQRANRWLRGGEEITKRAVFDCRMCGQCVLHSTGMTCPMSCPKNLRNGPCGGVRANGHCEVLPEMKCIWVEAFERSQQMPVYGNEILHIQ